MCALRIAATFPVPNEPVTTLGSGSVEDTAPEWRARTVRALRFLLLGSAPGALLYIGLFALCLWDRAAPEYMGVSDGALFERLEAIYRDDLVAQQLGFLAMYAAIGALVGLGALTWIRVVAPVPWRRWRLWGRLAAVVLLVVGVHGWFLISSMQTYPQLYGPHYAAAGGLGSVLFGLAVDVLPRWLVAGVGVAFVATFVGYGWLRIREIVAPRLRRARVPAYLAAGVATGVILALLLGGRSASLDGVHRDARRPNLLIVAVDSLRADLVGTPGGGAVAPHINRLAAESVLFESAYTVVPRTFPSWVSLLTGQYPHTHGIRHMFPTRAERSVKRRTLATAAREAGYRTAVISDFAGDIFSRTDLGFEHVDAPSFDLRSNVALAGAKLHVHLMPYLVDVLRGAGAPELAGFERLCDPAWLTDRATHWLASDDPRPFVLTVFYSAGHFPFASPAPFYDRFVDPDYRGRSRFHKESFADPLEGPARRAEEGHIAGLYRGAIAAADAAIGRLLDGFRDAGLLEDTIVVLTADHGEHLYEHALGVGHGDHLFGLESLKVPLVVRAGALAPSGTRVIGAVSTIDLAPTLSRLMGIAGPAPDGVDLSEALGGGAVVRPVFAETGLWFFEPETRRLDERRVVFADGYEAFRFSGEGGEIELDGRYSDTALMAKHRIVLRGPHKLLYMPTRDGVRWELYDVVADPDETRDLREAEPETFAALRDTLYAWMLRDPGMVRLGDFVVPKAPLGVVAATPGAR